MFTREGVEYNPTRTNDKGQPGVMIHFPCPRCGGQGQSAQWYRTGLTCYDCGGIGKHKHGPEFVRLYTAEELDTLNARRDALRAKKAAKLEAARIEREAAEELAREERRERLKSDPLFITLKKYEARSEFLADLLRRYRVADLSDKQVSAINDAVQRFVAHDEQAANSKHIGQPGDRVPLVIRCTLSRCIYEADPSGWRGGIPDSNRYLNKFETDTGDVVVIFSARSFKEGAEYAGTASVKAHDTYKGVAQTTVKNFREKKAKVEA